jgi:type IV pilus assembly protein PilW
MYRFNEGLARVQENGRFALEFIRRDVRVAGFWGCNSDTVPSNGIKTTSNAYIDVDAGDIAGTSDDGLNNADSITFRSATGSGALVTADMSGTDGLITVDNASALATGTAALISDCENGDLFQITGISETALAHAEGASANDSAELSKKYLAGARVYEARQTTYCVADGIGKDKDGKPIPSLRRAYGKNSVSDCETGEELLEGIENMQILYGEDTDADAEGANGDGTANRYVDFGVDDEFDPDRIVSVRISVLVRSINNNLTTEPSPYIYPPWANPPISTTPDEDDKHLRKIFTTTITLRNKAG